MAYSAIIGRMPGGLVAKAKLCARKDAHDDIRRWSHEELLDAVGVATGTPYFGISEENADYPAFVRDRKFYLAYGCVPLFREGTVVVVACAEPWSEKALRTFRKNLQCEVHPAGASEADIDSVLAHFSERAVRDAEAAAAVAPVLRSDPPCRAWDIREGREVEAIKLITAEAHRLSASDILIEPMENRTRVRFKIHDVGEEMPPMTREIGDMVVGAFKAYSNISSDDLTVPVSGRCRVEIRPGQFIDLRVECQPTEWGSAMIMRLLDPQSILKHLGTLPFTGKDLDLVKGVMDRDQGIVIVTGPTGSGKSTTLYRVLTSMDSSSLNIRTIEDPVEYLVDGITQVPAPKDKDGKPIFGDVLRSHLRAAPDVIMVGEIRDMDTAATAIQASLTGHLIVSTLHTNNALGTLQRLGDLKLSPYLVGETLALVIAQRLIRRLCPSCKIAVAPTPDVVGHYESHKIAVPGTIYTKGGCPSCNGLGIVGRLPVFELLYFSPQIKAAVQAGKPIDEIGQIWTDGGGESLAFRGLQLVSEGLAPHIDVRGFETSYVPDGGWIEEED